MRKPGRFVALAALVTMAGSLGWAQEPPRTFVSLSGSEDDYPRLGNPAIHVEVRSVSEELATALEGQLMSDLESMVHARPDRGDSPYDYRLRVLLDPPLNRGADDPLRFEASMEEPDRGIVWRTEGRTEIAGGLVDDAAIQGVSRNLVTALVHDRWVVRKIDPDNPPPAAPYVKPPR